MYAAPQSQTLDVENFRPLAQLIPAHWQSGDMQSPDGIHLHYTRTGAGEGKSAVVLLHGIQALGLMWLRVAQALEPNYDVIMPDCRAHGQSGGTERGFSARLLVNDMAALIAALELDRPLIVGHSMGAEIAGRLAALNTIPIRGVVLVDPALQSFTPMTDAGMATPPWLEAIMAIMRALKDLSHEERLREGLKLLPPGTTVTNESDYVSLIEGMAQFDQSAFQFVNNMSYLFKEPQTIKNIASPLLLMTARPTYPGANTGPGLAAFQKNWHHGQHIHFDNSGHFIPFEQYEAFMVALTRFFAEQN
ncbi:MAG: alpha/beta hydrolase [Burkholderiales bacterium]|nr:alpha/beta hydrolase [Anaerolineae bacterium]